MASITSNFRHVAHEALSRAKNELKTDDSDRLKYAALELRNAMEALTYSRALTLKDEIPPDEYKTWQPRKLMTMLVNMDASFGSSCTISVGIEEEYGKPAPMENMQVIGTDYVLKLADLKKHYDAIGSYLHVPSLGQVLSGKVQEPDKLRERCETVVNLVEKVLSSQMWGSAFGNYSTLSQCMNEDCKKPIRKRIPFGEDEVDVQCFECKAEYTVTSQADGQVTWKPKMVPIPCPSDGCTEKTYLWKHEVKQGTHWHCAHCGAHNTIALSVVNYEEEGEGSTS